MKEMGCGRLPVNHELFNFLASAYNYVICISFLISTPSFKKFTPKI